MDSDALTFPDVRLRSDMASTWAGAGILAFASGIVLARASDPVPLVVLVVLGVATLAAAVALPRMVMVASVFLFVGYVPDVLADATFPLVSQSLAGMVVCAMLVRRALAVERFPLPGELAAFAALGLAMAVSSALAADRGASTAEVLDYLGYATVAAVLMMLLDSSTWLRRALWAAVVAAAALALLALVQQATRSYATDYGGFATVVPAVDSFRSAGPLSPNYFGQLLATSAVLAFYLHRLSASGRQRLAAVAVTVLCLVGVAYTQSRGALVATLVALVAITLLGRVRLRVVVAALCGIFFLGAVALPENFRERVGALSMLATTDVRTSSDTALRGRAAENMAALRMWVDHPLVGVGPDNFEVHYQSYSQDIGIDPRAEGRAAHNLYLESLAETGLLGTVPFVAVLWLSVSGAWRARRVLKGDDALLAEAMFVGLVTFLTGSVTLHSAYPRYLWIFVGLALAARMLPSREVG